MNFEEQLVNHVDAAEKRVDEEKMAYATLQMEALEAKVRLDSAIRALTKADQMLALYRGDDLPAPVRESPLSVPLEVGPVVTVPADERPKSSLIEVATEIPAGPVVDPTSPAAQEGWVKGPDGRYYPPTEVRSAQDLAKHQQQARAEATANGPRCGACGKRGTLQQMQHSSGRILTGCTACGNQIW